MKRIVSLLLALLMVLSLAACAEPTPPATDPSGTTPPATNPPATNPPATNPPEPVEEYIEAPYTAADAAALTAQIYEPKFYENPNGGPTIGVTLLGVIKLGDMYFRDLNNNKKLDTFEDWRLPAEERAAAYAAAMTDEQLSYQLLNQMVYSPTKTTTADVVDENGKPVWTKIFNNGGSGSELTGPDHIKWLEEQGWRNYVLRNNPSVEVGVWFNNGMEQYAEFNALQTNTIAVPFLTFTNPISHGLPGSEGVTAASLGDGNADLLLKDAQYDRIVMWSKGIDALYGPQIDLVTDPRWSRNNGTYGEREDMASEIARALTIGYQNGDQGMVAGSVLLTVKHFPGDGAAFNGFESHGYPGRYRVYTTENSLADYQLKPFIAAFEAGAAGVMPGYSQPIIDDRIAPQSITYNGKTYDIKYEGYGNAFNADILQGLLREVLGFEGLINSDSVSQSNAHGVENLSGYEQTVLFVNAGCEAGVFSAAGSMGSMGIQPALIAEALEKGDIKRETLEAAAAKRALMQIKSGNMDCPYRNLEESKAAIDGIQADIDALAEEFHLKSVVLMKNHDNTLPLKDTSKKVYVAGFNQKGNQNVKSMIAAFEAEGFTVVEDYNDADIAFLYVNPTIVGQGSGNLAILDLVEGVDTPIFDNDAKPTGEYASITTVADMKEFQKIANAVHAKGGKVVGRIEASNAWILTEMEPYCDALIGTFNTRDTAVAQVLVGKYNPTGKLPITMVSCAEVIALETKTFGDVTWEVCVSPSDVPGYVKDQYISKDVLAQSPSGSYAYKDADGNFYWSGHGLSY